MRGRPRDRPASELTTDACRHLGPDSDLDEQETPTPRVSRSRTAPTHTRALSRITAVAATRATVAPRRFLARSRKSSRVVSWLVQRQTSDLTMRGLRRDDCAPRTGREPRATSRLDGLSVQCCGPLADRRLCPTAQSRSSARALPNPRGQATVGRQTCWTAAGRLPGRPFESATPAVDTARGTVRSDRPPAREHVASAPDCLRRRTRVSISPLVPVAMTTRRRETGSGASQRCCSS